MKTKLLFTLALLLLAVTLYATDSTGPEPAPWWQRVEETQSLALKWTGALTVILGAVATLVAFVIGKVNELKDRVEKQSNRVDSQQQQITSIALSTPAAAKLPPESPSNPTVTP